MPEPIVPSTGGWTDDGPSPTADPALTRPPATPADTDTVSQPPPGPKQAAALPSIPGYEILGVLGRGGMGVVYHARQLGLKRPVAIKMILAGGHASDQDRTRFRAEAEAIARLRHPNIVQVYEVGEADGHLYFSMEYVEGGNLAARRDWTPHEAAKVVETLARAVHHAHAQKVVHRDLKPANVLLTADRTPKVTDFGLAKRLDASAANTATGAILGTPGYMAPEQASGRGKAVGPAADVWALGAILYHLLTGRPPFQADTPFDTLLEVVTTLVTPPRKRNPAVPVDLDSVCLRCLQRVPERRYPSAEELAEELRRFQTDEPVLARPQNVASRVWSRTRGSFVGSLEVIRLGVRSVRRPRWWVRSLGHENAKPERQFDWKPNAQPINIRRELARSWENVERRWGDYPLAFVVFAAAFVVGITFRRSDWLPVQVEVIAIVALALAIGFVQVLAMLRRRRRMTATASTIPRSMPTADGWSWKANDAQPADVEADMPAGLRTSHAGREYLASDEPVPGYRLVRCLGKGPLGQVWVANSPGDVEVALKIVKLEGIGWKAFRAVGQVKRHLRHPNLIPIYAYWLKDEYGNFLDSTAEAAVNIRGRSSELIIAAGMGQISLAGRFNECKQGGMPGIPFEELLWQMAGAAQAIDFLNEPTHALGEGPTQAVHHCDIRPSNVLIAANEVQVCYYGLSQVAIGDLQTPLVAIPYMAPELIAGKPTVGTDQYSLAITYYELRTGKLPFEEQLAFHAHITGQLDFAQASFGEEEVLRRATALRPDQRFPTAREFVAALKMAVTSG